MGSTGGGPEERILSHGDVALIRSDLDVLRLPRFINDRIIVFYFAHLSAAVDDSSDLLLLPPSIPLLSNLPDAAASRCSPSTTTPTPPSPRAAPTGPSSSSTAPAPPRASSTTSAFAARPTSPSRAASPTRSAPCSSTPRGGFLRLSRGPHRGRPNGYDCGVYVMAVAKAIRGWWRDGRGGGESSDWFEAVKGEVNAASVTALRAELLELIDRLIQEKANSKPERGKEH